MRAFFSDRMLQRYRARGTANRPHSATRLVPTDSYGEGGVTTTSYAPGATYSCRYEPVGVAEGAAQGSVVASTEGELALPMDAVARPRDRFLVTGTALDGTAWARTVEVIGTPGPHTFEAERSVRVTAVNPQSVSYGLQLTSSVGVSGAQV